MRQKLGQHFLTSQAIASSIVSAATITRNDVVLEIGTGKGILVPLLCKKAKTVISIEADKMLYDDAIRTFSDISNLKLKHEDGFQTTSNFSIFVSNLPYSRSKNAIEWLAQKKFSHAIIMVQKEFAEKLLADSKERKAISVLANHAFEITTIMKVGKNNFSPPPKIDSVVLKLIRKKTITDELIRTINKIFSYRRKTIQNIFKQFGIDKKSDKRIDDLTNEEIIKIAKQIIKK